MINSTTGEIVQVPDALVYADGRWSLQAAGGGGVPATRTIATTSPLTGGGDLSADRTISIPAATSTAGGYMTTAQVTSLAGKIDSSTKGVANGVASLDSGGKVPSSQLPTAPVTSVDGRTGAVTLSDLYDASGAAAAAQAASQPVNANLTAIAGQTTAADRLTYWTGAATAALATLTAFGRSFIAATDAAAAKLLLALVKADVGLSNVDNTADATKSVLYATTAGGAPPTGTAGGDLTGTYPSPTLAAIVTAATKGTAAKSATVTIDATGRVTSLTDQDIAITKAQAGLSNVDNTADATKSVLYAATAGGAPPTGAASGDLTGTYPGPTLAAVTTATTLGSATKSVTVTVDAKGRVTALTENTITATDATKLPLAGGTMTGTLVLRTGSATAGTSPVKFVSGSLLTAPEAGAVEFLTDDLLFTISTGTARKRLALCDATLTSGRVPFATTNGRLLDSANLTYTDSTAVLTMTLSSNALIGPVVNNQNAGTATIAGYKCNTAVSNVIFGAGSSASVYSGGAIIYTGDPVPISFWNNGLRRMTINSSGLVGIGVSNATASLHLVAGTATASTAPLKVNSGTLMSSAEAGAVEYDGTDWYLTDSTPTRRTVDYLPTVTSSATPVTVPAKGGFVRVVGAAGAKTVNLPALSGVKTGARVIVKDSAGNAASGTITITPNGSDTIDGAASATITTNNGVLRLFATGSAGRWEVW